MSFSPLPLGYCTNVHPGRTLAEVESGLDRFTVPVQERAGGPIAAGLWLAAPVVAELRSSPDAVPRFAAGLARRGLTCHTLNAFPFGDFHSDRVKEKVYLPDWSQPERLDYTSQCAEVLASLLPEGVDGSISTLPLAFKPIPHPPEFVDACVDQLIELAGRLDRLRRATGRTIRLAIEPEPFCLLETTPEAIAFFHRLSDRADRRGAGAIVREHVGLCYDVCHQAVEFEDAAEAVAALHAAGVRINKAQISCAIEIASPGDDRAAREALATYVEPRYLHQTMARTKSGGVIRSVDLTRSLALDPPADFAEAEMWRVHFHVPVDAETVGPLGTTRAELRRALAAIGELPYAPHLEVETYTWDVLPGATADLVEGLSRELTATRGLCHGALLGAE